MTNPMKKRMTSEEDRVHIIIQLQSVLDLFTNVRERIDQCVCSNSISLIFFASKLANACVATQLQGENAFNVWDIFADIRKRIDLCVGVISHTRGAAE